MKILIRARKAPYVRVKPVTALKRNIAGTNIGNMLFQESVFKALSMPENEVIPNGYGVRPKNDQECDVLVLPFANQFRPNFGERLERMAAAIAESKVPVVVVGIGCQTDLDYRFENLAGIEEPAKKFVAAVLDHSASIGVRGEATAEYLKQLGFHDVDIIGCPSMFINGGEFPTPRPVEDFTTSTKLAVNISAPGEQAKFSVGLDRMGVAIAQTTADYEDVVYIPQENRSVHDLLTGNKPEVGEHSGIPDAVYEAMYGQGSVKAFVDPRPWIDYLATREFVFGTRLHGVIAGLLAGTPAHLVVHDSRTLELARYFGIPHTFIRDLADPVDARNLYESSDYSEMTKGHAERFAAYSAFLGRNGLKHVFAEGDGGEEFEAKMRQADLPGPISSGPRPVAPAELQPVQIAPLQEIAPKALPLKTAAAGPTSEPSAAEPTPAAAAAGPTPAPAATRPTPGSTVSSFAARLVRGGRRLARAVRR